MNGRLVVHPSLDELTRGVAGHIASLLVSAARSRGRAMIALSGGSTPQGVHALLGSYPFRSKVPWDKVHVFWGDERCVPPEDPESNFRMAKDALLRHIAIPPLNVHRIKGELNPVDAADSYEEDIRRAFEVEGNVVPRFDAVMLGLGDDGHTASLFPGTSVLDERKRLVSAVFVEKLKTHRITMTIPVINNAHQVLFLVSGKDKSAVLREVIEEDTLRYPAEYIQPGAGELLWCVDMDAASQLKTTRKR